MGLFTKAELDKIIKEYLASEDGYELIAEQSMDEAIEIAEDFIQMLGGHIIKDTQSRGRTKRSHGDNVSYRRDGLKNFNTSAIAAGKPKHVGKGKTHIDIVIDEDALERESLVKQQTGKGENLHDVISLFVHGYDAKNHAYGDWHNMRIATPIHKDKNAFLQRAIDEFNKKYDGTATVKLADAYTNRTNGGE